MIILKRSKPQDRGYPVPFTNGRYVYSVSSGLYDHVKGEYIRPDFIEKTPVYPMFDFGFPSVGIALSDKRIYVPIWCIVLLTYKGFSAPPEVLNAVRPMYLDDNSKNISPDNVVYVFESPTEPYGWPGFAYIPGYTRYACDEAGTIVSLVTGEIKRGVPNANGYWHGNIPNDCNIRNGQSVLHHRMVAVAWKPPSLEQLFEWEVDHIDDDPKNKRVSNLQWMRVEDNIAKARMGRVKRLKKIYAGNYSSASKHKGCRTLDLLTGDIVEHSNIASAAKHVNRSKGAITLALRSAVEDTLPIVGGKYWVVHAGVEFPAVPADIEEKIKASNAIKVIVAKRLVDGKEFKFPSASAFFAEHGISRKLGFKYLERKIQEPLGGFLFKCELDETPWNTNHF